MEKDCEKKEEEALRAKAEAGGETSLLSFSFSPKWRNREKEGEMVEFSPSSFPCLTFIHTKGTVHSGGEPFLRLEALSFPAFILASIVPT